MNERMTSHLYLSQQQQQQQQQAPRAWELQIAATHRGRSRQQPTASLTSASPHFRTAATGN